jgi:hypothetical protein
MEAGKMRQIAIIFVVSFILTTTTGIIAPVQGYSEERLFPSPMGIVNISAVLPDSPSDIVAYRIKRYDVFFRE